MGFCDYQSESTFHRDRPEDVFYVAPTKLALHFHGVCVNVSVNVLLGMGLAAALANVPRWSGGWGRGRVFAVRKATPRHVPSSFLSAHSQCIEERGARSGVQKPTPPQTQRGELSRAPHV